MMITLPKGAELYSAEIMLTQEADCCADANVDTSIKAEIHDGGAGKYLVINGRWAMDGESEIQAFADTLKAFLKSCEDSK